MARRRLPSEVRITSVKAGQSKTGGTPQVEVEFSSHSGKTTRDWFVTEGQQKFKLAALALACGWKKEDLLGSVLTEQLPGKRLKVVQEIVGKTEPDHKNKYENSPPCRRDQRRAPAPGRDSRSAHGYVGRIPSDLWGVPHRMLDNRPCSPSRHGAGEVSQRTTPRQYSWLEINFCCIYLGFCWPLTWF